MNKYIILLFLLVAVSTEEIPVEGNQDIIEIIKCFLGKESLINDIKELIAILKEGDYSKLLTIAFKLYVDGMAAYKECVPTMLTFASKQKRYDNCVRMCKNMIKRPPVKHLTVMKNVCIFCILLGNIMLS